MKLLPNADLKERVDLLDEHMVRVFEEIERVRQEVTAGDANLRQMIEQRASEQRVAAEAQTTKPQ